MCARDHSCSVTLACSRRVFCSAGRGDGRGGGHVGGRGHDVTELARPHWTNRSRDPAVARQIQARLSCKALVVPLLAPSPALWRQPKAITEFQRMH
ncbi:hypothetical protein FKM82_000801 [Ascaphus truei]